MQVDVHNLVVANSDPPEYRQDDLPFVFHFEPLRLSYYYLETSERATVDKTSERLAEDRQTILNVAEGIRGELLPAKPDRMKCSGCDFRMLFPSAAV